MSRRIVYVLLGLLVGLGGGFALSVLVWRWNW